MSLRARAGVAEPAPPGARLHLVLRAGLATNVAVGTEFSPEEVRTLLGKLRTIGGDLVNFVRRGRERRELINAHAEAMRLLSEQVDQMQALITASGYTSTAQAREIFTLRAELAQQRDLAGTYITEITELRRQLSSARDEAAEAQTATDAALQALAAERRAREAGGGANADEVRRLEAQLAESRAQVEQQTRVAASALAELATAGVQLVQREQSASALIGRQLPDAPSEAGSFESVPTLEPSTPVSPGSHHPDSDPDDVVGIPRDPMAQAALLRMAVANQDVDEVSRLLDALPNVPVRVSTPHMMPWLITDVLFFPPSAPFVPFYYQRTTTGPLRSNFTPKGTVRTLERSKQIVDLFYDWGLRNVSPSLPQPMKVLMTPIALVPSLDEAKQLSYHGLWKPGLVAIKDRFPYEKPWWKDAFEELKRVMANGAASDQKQVFEHAQRLGDYVEIFPFDDYAFMWPTTSLIRNAWWDTIKTNVAAMFAPGESIFSADDSHRRKVIHDAMVSAQLLEGPYKLDGANYPYRRGADGVLPSMPPTPLPQTPDAGPVGDFPFVWRS